MDRKLTQRHSFQVPRTIFSSLSPQHFSLQCSHAFPSLSLEKWETTSKKKCIEKQHKVHPSHLSRWQFKGALPTCNPVVCFKNCLPKEKETSKSWKQILPQRKFLSESATWSFHLRLSPLSGFFLQTLTLVLYFCGQLEKE